MGVWRWMPWLALVACGAPRAAEPARPQGIPRSAPVGEEPVRPRSSWDSAAALAQCRSALDVARQTEPPTSRAARVLEASCTSLIADEPCRRGLRELLERDQLPVAPAVVRTCAARYCPDLGPALERLCPDEACRVGVREQVAKLCREPMPSSDAGWSTLFGKLRGAMLLHDFAEDDLRGVVDLQRAVLEYALRVPLPSLVDAREPGLELELELETSGAFTVRGPGVERTGKSVAEISSQVPRTTDEGAVITIVADPGIQHQQLIQAMAALRELGYKKMRFGAPR